MTPDISSKKKVFLTWGHFYSRNYNKIYIKIILKFLKGKMKIRYEFSACIYTHFHQELEQTPKNTPNFFCVFQLAIPDESVCIYMPKIRI